MDVYIGNDKVTFRRIHGRIVPIKTKRKKHDVDYLDSRSIAQGVGAGVAAMAPVATYMTKFRDMFKSKGKRLAAVSRTYGETQLPRYPVGHPKKVGKKIVYDKKPDMFQLKEYANKMQIYSSRIEKSNRYGRLSRHYMKKASVLRKLRTPVSIGFGVLTGASTYLASIAVDNRRTKKSYQALTVEE